jgi:gas vesicle protein
MGVLGRIGAFLGGGLLGAGIGAVIATLVAPQSGDDLRREVDRRVDQVKVAGLEARSARKRS